MTIDRVGLIAKAVKILTTTKVYVGIPSTRTDRRDGEITNAALGYIHTYGVPNLGIPPRAFLVPGVQSVQGEISQRLVSAGKLALQGNTQAITKTYHAIGLIAQTAVKRKINDGPFTPLADSTVARRAAKGRQGAIQELANRRAGMAPSTDLVKPLIDTAQLRNSISYVIR